MCAMDGKAHALPTELLSPVREAKSSVLPTKGVLVKTIENAKVPMPKGQKT
jgi:hypothetical protein